MTPTIAAHVGDSVKIHVLRAFSEQVQLFSVWGHEWKHEPYLPGAHLASTVEFGRTGVINACLHGGAGGPNGIPDDYLWLNQRPGYLDAGHWGMLKVLDRNSRTILPRDEQTPASQRMRTRSPRSFVGQGRRTCLPARQADSVGPFHSLMWRRVFDLALLIWPAVILIESLTCEAVALDFSAERVVKRGKSVVTAHVNAKDDRWRFEFTQPQGGASIIIVRMDHATSWLILSKRRQYLEVPVAHDHRLVVSEAMDGEISREFVGEETLNGYPTELFEVTVKDRDETRQYYRWVTKTQRFPLKTVSKQGEWSEEFRRVIFTEQSPFLFELPRRLDPANPPVNMQPTPNEAQGLEEVRQ